MAWQRFGASNAPETCLWCGRRLPWMIDRDYAQRNADGKRGGYGDGLFCGLRCGYQFGVVLAEGGRRLRPVPAGEGV